MLGPQPKFNSNPPDGSASLTEAGQNSAPPHSGPDDDFGKWAYPAVALHMALFLGVGIPTSRVALVYWVYGSTGYHRDGIRVAKARPTKFTNGEKPPQAAEIPITFVAFFLCAAISFGFVARVKRLYGRIIERFVRRRG